MDKKNPAFPGLGKWNEDDMNYAYSGMSLRDYFAAKAMAVILSDFLLKEDAGDVLHVSRVAYRMADAMMKERGNE